MGCSEQNKPLLHHPAQLLPLMISDSTIVTK